MRQTLAAVAAAWLIPTLGHAASGIDHVSAQCSSALTVQQGDHFSLNCAGDLLLSGDGQQGLIDADASILLSASGNLKLVSLSLTSPSIILSTDHGDIEVASDVRFGSSKEASPPFVRLQAGPSTIVPDLSPEAGLIVHANEDVHIAPGSLTLIPSAVPEPSTALLTLVGAGIGAWIARRRHGQASTFLRA